VQRCQRVLDGTQRDANVPYPPGAQDYRRGVRDCRIAHAVSQRPTGGRPAWHAGAPALVQRKPPPEAIIDSWHTKRDAAGSASQQRDRSSLVIKYYDLERLARMELVMATSHSIKDRLDFLRIDGAVRAILTDFMPTL